MSSPVFNVLSPKDFKTYSQARLAAFEKWLDRHNKTKKAKGFRALLERWKDA
jgi:hypothetical protein